MHALTRAESVFVASLVAAHVTLCRQRSEHLRNALAVIIPEANLPFASIDMCQALKNQLQLPNCIFVMEDRSQGYASGTSQQAQYDMPGSHTTRAKKAQMMHLLKTRYMQTRRICFHAPFVQADLERCRVPCMKSEIVKQLRGFCQKLVPRVSHDGTIASELVYSGKPPIGSGDDDYVIVLLMAVYQEKRFFENPRNQCYWFGSGGNASAIRAQ